VTPFTGLPSAGDKKKGNGKGGKYTGKPSKGVAKGSGKGGKGTGPPPKGGETVRTKGGTGGRADGRAREDRRGRQKAAETTAHKTLIERKARDKGKGPAAEEGKARGGEEQGLTLIHCTAQPEPLLTPNSRQNA
jgi:hypothetical protein